ncbi:40s ribosomal protein s5-1 [Hordeum vulgare]|nr:40s ribosomal protein s5-1 [Hordeum vulgare]
MLHIRDVEGPKKSGSVQTRIEAMEQQVFKCQGMVERGLNANHMMITEFTNKHMIDANDIGKHLSRLYERIDQLQAQIYDLQNQNSIIFQTEMEEKMTAPVQEGDERKSSFSVVAEVLTKHCPSSKTAFGSSFCALDNRFCDSTWFSSIFCDSSWFGSIFCGLCGVNLYQIVLDVW